MNNVYIERIFVVNTFLYFMNTVVPEALRVWYGAYNPEASELIEIDGSDSEILTKLKEINKDFEYECPLFPGFIFDQRLMNRIEDYKSLRYNRLYHKLLYKDLGVEVCNVLNQMGLENVYAKPKAKRVLLNAYKEYVIKAADAFAEELADAINNQDIGDDYNEIFDEE